MYFPSFPKTFCGYQFYCYHSSRSYLHVRVKLNTTGLFVSTAPPSYSIFVYEVLKYDVVKYDVIMCNTSKEKSLLFLQFYDYCKSFDIKCLHFNAYFQYIHTIDRKSLLMSSVYKAVNLVPLKTFHICNGRIKHPKVNSLNLDSYFRGNLLLLTQSLHAAVICLG